MGKLFATNSPIGNVTPLLVISNDTCFFIDLFCLPVAPTSIMLFIGRVGMGKLLFCLILSNSTLSINDTFDPVSMSNVASIPLISALICTIPLFPLL